MLAGPLVRGFSVWLALTAVWGVGGDIAVAAPAWATGAEFQRRMARPVNVTWSQNPLRRGLRNLCNAQHVALLTDRRVDPGQEVDLQLHNRPLQEVFETIAESRRLGVSFLGSVVYFGPSRASSRLRTLAAVRSEELEGLPQTIARKFRHPKRIAWEDFATPRELLAQLGRENGLDFVGLKQVPHDLWGEADLPPLSLVDRLTLIAVQFDLTFRVSGDGKTVGLVEIPADLGLVRSYPGGLQPKATAERFAALAPDARINVVGSKVYVKGLLEEHQRLSSRRGPPRQVQTPAASQIERVRIDKVSFQELPVGVVLQKLAAQLNLDLRIDHDGLRRAGISLQQPVSVTAAKVTVDELLGEVIRPTRLRFSRRGNVVQIGPAAP